MFCVEFAEHNLTPLEPGFTAVRMGFLRCILVSGHHFFFFFLCEGELGHSGVAAVYALTVDAVTGSMSAVEFLNICGR